MSLGQDGAPVLAKILRETAARLGPIGKPIPIL